MAAGEVDDRKPAKAEAERAVEEKPSSSGPRCAMESAIRGSLCVDRLVGKVKLPGDAAHLSGLYAEVYG